MRYYGIMDTSVRTFNQGDYIIVESVKRQLNDCLANSFVVDLPTHSPVMRPGEFGLRPYRNSDYRGLKRLDCIFLCGTNLLAHRISNRWNQWNILEGDLEVLGGKVVAVGVGSAPHFSSFSRRAAKLYSGMFSSQYIHSARDERTKDLLIDAGIRALNTGCATMWQLTDEHCAAIPSKKSDVVVTTLTDYKKDKEHDLRLLQLLYRHYDKVYFWIQGIDDLSYIEEIGFADKVEFISPSLDAYNFFLDNVQCDFIGTRLHAGIKAMQKKKRSIILGVDNRSSDIAKTYGINYVPRDDTDGIEKMMLSSVRTRVGIKEDAISEFLSQFGAHYGA